MPDNAEKVSNFYYVEFYLDFHAGKFKGQRFGQAFLNAFYPEIGEDDHGLFYEENTDKAVEIIFAYYIDHSLSHDSGRKYTGRSLFAEE